MSDKRKFLLSFRTRLTLLWTVFLVLAIVIVIVVDREVQKQIDNEVEQRNSQVRVAVDTGFGDFARAINLAQMSLADEQTFLYETPQKVPPSVEHIIVTDEKGLVHDSTIRDLIQQTIAVPERPEGFPEGNAGDPVESEVQIPHGGLTKTYDLPINTTKGLYWIVIVMNQKAIINKIDDASTALLSRNRQWSNVRIAITSFGLLTALVIAVLIGGRFTRPIKDLAASARRVAAGDLDFKVNLARRDEIGELAATFDEMIAGLKSKKELEEKLNQSEKAAVIGRLTQGVAHEIRNPLNVLNLAIDHVGAKFPPEGEEKKKQFASILLSIKDEIARLNRMVTDLLNFGRPAQLSFATVDMAALVKETLSLIRPQADDQGVEIKLDDGGADVALVLGDSERLRSCVSNIAINALQAMPSGGQLETTLHKRNGNIELSIHDTGTGIDEASLEKIFEPYFSTKKSGIGLGLAVTKKLIEEHHGTIVADSKLGEGTTFVVNLPAAK